MKIGDTVKIIDKNIYGIIKNINKNLIIINCNNKVITTNIENVILANKPEKRNHFKYHYEKSSINFDISSKPETELMIRHQTSIEAMENVQKFLDTAYLYKLPYVKIIHGKHGGVLKKELHKLLDTLSFVDSYYLGDHYNGQNGVTIVKLKY